MKKKKRKYRFWEDWRDETGKSCFARDIDRAGIELRQIKKKTFEGGERRNVHDFDAIEWWNGSK